MFKRNLFFLSILLCSIVSVQAQVEDGAEVTNIPKEQEDGVVLKPIVDYSVSKIYEVADIRVVSPKNSMYEDHVLISFSGIAIGDKIDVPGGNEITNAMNRFWKQGLFSDVSISIDKIQGSKIWLCIELEERPRISDIQYSGLKKGERKDIADRINLIKNLQLTPNQLSRAERTVKKYLDGKGFNKAIINISQSPDLSKENHVILKIDVQKNYKTKVSKVLIEGNDNVKSSVLENSMKKTRHKSTLRAMIRNILRSTNYVPENYEEDKNNIISKYNELGYRDAAIVWDSVYSGKKRHKVTVAIKVEEGQKYFLRDIKWVGNTEYPTYQLNHLLGMKPGDVYNQKKLMGNLSQNQDAVMNYLYQNNGYLFSRADPIEINIEKDSVELEIRIHEGKQATIRRVSIYGNDKLYEDVIRRELRIKPGELFSRDAIMRSMLEINQMGHFDPENLEPKIEPDMDDGMVDIILPLTSKANDQIEFSAGWGQTGIIGKLSLKFSNFSIKNLFNPGSYKGLLPQGEGQTLTLSGQTNGRFYQSYSISFFDPWFGGKRPNSLSVGAYYSRQTDVVSRYSNNNYFGYGGYDAYSSGGYGYGGYSSTADPDKSMEIIGISGGYGKRLSWPDDYFHFQAELAYQVYKLRDWRYFIVKDGSCNSLSLSLSLSRQTIDNPTYTRRGTAFSIGVEITPPFSWWDGKDYKNMKPVVDADGGGIYENGDKFRWIEYHKWKFKAKTFISLADVNKTPVLMTRVEFGAVGYFNKYKKSPFGTYYMGGDGMSGSSSSYANETIGLRGYQSGALGTQASSYTRLALELRYPIILEPSSTIYVLAFAEAGNAWYDLKDINPFDLKRSAGFGARIFLPMIGLMGLDWAYGFDPINRSRDRSGSQLHFIIGQEF